MSSASARFIEFEHLELGRTHGQAGTDFLQRVLIDPSGHEFALGNFRNSFKLFIGRNRIDESVNES
jgi:hypothetical protein